MNKKWSTGILIFIFVGLFILPHFWLGHNQFHLGGDDSRAYLYQPLEWLTNIGFWPKVTVNLFSSGIPQHMYIPFVLLAGLIQQLLFFLNLQAVLYGLCLSLGFLSVYLLVREVLRSDTVAAYVSAIVGGLVYILLPLSYVTFFLNPVKYIFIIFVFPLLLYFYLKAIRKKNILFLFFGALLSGVFSISFSEIPYLYAFFISSGLFFLFSLIVLPNKLLLIRYALIYIGLILLCNFFWIFPFFVAPFYGENIVNSALSEKSRADNLAGIRLGAANHNLVDTLLGLKGRTLYNEVIFMKELYAFSFINLVFPLLIFAGLLFRNISRREKKIYLISLITLLVLAFLQTVNIGTWGPQLFEYLVKTVPGFVSIRNYDYKVAPSYLLFYSLVLSISLYMLFTVIKKRQIIIGSIVFILAVVLFFNSRPFIDGRVLSFSLVKNGQIDRIVEVPEDYNQLLQNSVPQWPDSRVVTLPFTFGSWSIFLDGKGGAYIGHPLTQVIGGRDSWGGALSFSDQSLPALQNLVNSAFVYEDYELLHSLFGFFNVKNIVYHPSVFDKSTPEELLNNQLWDHNQGFTEKKYQGFLNTFTQEEKVTGKSYEVYSIRNEEYVPHVYAATIAIDIDNLNSMLPDIHFLRNLDNNAVLSERSKLGQYPAQSELGQFAKYVVNKADCIECHAEKEPDLILPYVAILPTSPLYRYITLKEEQVEEQRLASGDIAAIVDIKLERAGKRLQEFELLINERANEGILISSIEEFENKINNVFAYVENEELGVQTNNEQYKKIETQLKFYRRKLGEYFNRLPINTVLESLVEKKLENLDKRIAQSKSARWSSDDNTLKYIVTSPADLQYDLYLKDFDASTAGELQMKIGQNPLIIPKQNVASSNPISLGSHNFTEGENLITINNSSVNVISENDRSFIVRDNADKSVPVPGFQWQKRYRVTFEYHLTSNDDANFYVQQDNDTVSMYGFPNRAVSEDLLPNLGFDKVSIVLDPNIDAKEAALHFQTKVKNTTLRVQNLQVREELTPSILLVQNIKKETYLPPKVTFQRINPIRYEVHIEDAHNPYVLVLSDAYHKGWILTQDNDISLQKGSHQYTYLEGRVNELTPQNILFEPKYVIPAEQIAKDKHINVNGYANAWYITPDDVGKKSEYTLVITFWPQQLFYFAAAVTLLGIIVILFFLWKLYGKNN